MKTSSIIKAALSAACVVMIAASANADAITYTFYNLTHNVGNTDVGSQLSVDVTGSGSTVSFRFFNNVGTASSICDIYFADGPLLEISSITDSDGPTAGKSGKAVAFSSLAKPSELPGGNNASPTFITTEGFSADSDSPVQPSGVNAAGEWVQIDFDLKAGKTFLDTITALNSGALRIGLHIQGIGATGGSDSYINRVPDGGITVALLGSALVGIGLLRRKFSRN
jgi:hypothetical protein